MEAPQPAPKKVWNGPPKSAGTQRGIETPVSGRATPSRAQQQGRISQSWSALASNSPVTAELEQLRLAAVCLDPHELDTVLSHRLSEIGDDSLGDDRNRQDMNLAGQVAQTLSEDRRQAGPSEVGRSGARTPLGHSQPKVIS